MLARKPDGADRAIEALIRARGDAPQPMEPGQIDRVIAGQARGGKPRFFHIAAKHGARNPERARNRAVRRHGAAVVADQANLQRHRHVSTPRLERRFAYNSTPTDTIQLTMTVANPEPPAASLQFVASR